jgi:uncharacterized membrane protein YqjE
MMMMMIMIIIIIIMINSNDRVAATMYSLGTFFCLGNTCINTLHKGDDDDDDNKLPQNM